MNKIVVLFSVAKIKIEENVIVDGMTRITAQRKKKVYKSGSWTKSEQRQPTVYLENGGNCDCRPLDDPQNDGGSFLVMGKRKNGKDVVEYFQVYNRKSKTLRKAFRYVISQLRPNKCVPTEGKIKERMQVKKAPWL